MFETVDFSGLTIVLVATEPWIRPVQLKAFEQVLAG
jgi:hypothetical protein